MLRRILGLSVALVLASILAPAAVGQMSGSRAGSSAACSTWGACRTFDPKVAEGYITVEGRGSPRAADRRPHRPGRDRRGRDLPEVPAVDRCRRSSGLKGAWTKMGIGPERIVVDFIAVLPRYQWLAEKHGNEKSRSRRRPATACKPTSTWPPKARPRPARRWAGPWNRASPTSSPSTIGARTSTK